MFTIEKVGLAEADSLLAISKKTFFDSFAHQNTAEDMEAYAAVAFSRTKIIDELTNPYSAFYFALFQGDIVGYIKLNFGPAQNEFKDDKALEIERIYVLAQHQGKQFGKQLLNFAIRQAADKQLDYLWLGVWEKNQKAIGFYQHHGFKAVGSHEFWLGGDRQVDLLMKMQLNN